MNERYISRLTLFSKQLNHELVFYINTTIAATTSNVTAIVYTT